MASRALYNYKKKITSSGKKLHYIFYMRKNSKTSI